MNATALLTVPAADTVGHNPLEAAKPLLLLGWTAPAALICRVAFEEVLRNYIYAHGYRNAFTYRTGNVLKVIRHKRMVPRDTYGRLDDLNRKLSRLAHGGDAVLHEAMRLIEDTERAIAELAHA